MTRPSFQFYPKDWLGNTKLRRCSAAARGVWMDVLCVLHDSDEYGIARYPLAELANAAGAPLKLLRELADKGVLKGCDKGACDGYVYLPRSGRKVGAPVTLVQPQAGPIWFSSRFVKDEHLRTVRAEGGMGEGSGAPPRPTPKASPKGGFGACFDASFGVASLVSPKREPSPRLRRTYSSRTIRDEYQIGPGWDSISTTGSPSLRPLRGV